EKPVVEPAIQVDPTPGVVGTLGRFELEVAEVLGTLIAVHCHTLAAARNLDKGSGGALVGRSRMCANWCICSAAWKRLGQISLGTARRHSRDLVTREDLSRAARFVRPKAYLAGASAPFLSRRSRQLRADARQGLWAPGRPGCSRPRGRGSAVGEDRGDEG